MTGNDSKGNKRSGAGEIGALCPLRATLQLGLKKELDSEQEGQGLCTDDGMTDDGGCAGLRGPSARRTPVFGPSKTAHLASRNCLCRETPMEK